jgi:hypothetical protein
MLRGISGEFEVNRVVGAVGALSYVVGAHTFIAWDMLYNGRPFDVTAYCLAFPAGLGVAVGAIAGAVAIKDRNVATARIVQDTGGQPTAATAPASSPQPVTVVNKPDEPVPTTSEEMKP